MAEIPDHLALLNSKRAEIRQIADRHGAHNIRIFGSVARGDARAGSDFDFLVDAGQVISSWFPAGLILDLEEVLGQRVEVVTEQGLDPLLRATVLGEAISV